MKRILVVTAVEAERRAITAGAGVRVVAGGVGRTNAACETTAALLADRYDAVVNAGVAGALPGSDLEVGATVVASECVYAEEGLLAPAGFVDIAAIGLTLGDFPGNTVPVDPDMLDRLAARFPVGPIVTVATCSGTDAQAAALAARTGAVAEAMEGAAVVHAARRQRVPAIELRVISNRTGDRSRQGWDLDLALTRLGAVVAEALATLRN